MLSFTNKLKKYKKAFAVLIISLAAAPAAWAGSPPAPSLFSNPLAVTFLVLMALLLIIIAVLANILLGAADIKVKKTKARKNNPVAVALSLFFLLITSVVSAQNGTDTAQNTTAAANTIGGMSSSAFYVMSAVIFLELFIILILLVNIKLLLKNETEKAGELETEKIKKPVSNWWTKINSFKPVEQEADIDLGHDYDGIRELDNRLPPWWIYGFYITIIVAAIYLWRYHVSHTAPSSIQEFETEMAQADIKVKEYLKQKGESVDENSVTLLTSPDDIAAGKKIYAVSCISCHKETGAGDVGPNLTDDYWMHGGDVKNVFKTIRYGVNAMPQWQNAYSNKQIAQVVGYLKTLQGSNPPNAKAPQGELYKEEIAPAKSTTDSAANKEVKTAM